MRWATVAVVAWTASAEPVEPFWGGEKTAKKISRLDEGLELEHALELTKARLRGLQRHGDRQREEHALVQQSFEAMNETLHTVLEPKLRKARERVNATAEAEAAAAAAAEAQEAAHADAAAGLEDARARTANATASIEAADAAMLVAQQAKAAAEEELAEGRHATSFMEQKVEFEEARARGARSTEATRHKLAADTAAGERQLEVIASIEKDRVEHGATRAVAAAEHSTEETDAAVKAAEEDVAVLEEKQAAWEAAQGDREQQQAVAHAEELQRQADAAAQQAVVLAHRRAPRKRPQGDWAWSPSGDLSPFTR